MNDIKVFVKADPSKELQDEIIEILEINQNCFKGTNEPNLHSAENIVDLFKPISLTELMVGFAESIEAEDVKRWFQLLIGKSDEEMKKDILKTFKSKGVVL